MQAHVMIQNPPIEQSIRKLLFLADSFPPPAKPVPASTMDAFNFRLTLVLTLCYTPKPDHQITKKDHRCSLKATSPSRRPEKKFGTF